MKKNITAWIPEHCNGICEHTQTEKDSEICKCASLPKCEIHVMWDGDLAAEERVHTAVDYYIDSDGRERRPQYCDNHKDSFKDHHEHYKNVLSENQTKNNFLNHLQDVAPHLFETLQSKDGNEYRQLKDEFKYSYQFEGKGANRVLIPKITGASLTIEEKSTIIEKMNGDESIEIKKVIQEIQ